MAWSHSGATRWRLSVGALMVLSLVACGGGGGKKDATPTPQPSGKIRLGGVVSKGLTGNALVKVYGVTSGGVLDTSSVLAEGTTNDQGVYSTGEFTAPATYVVEVRARDCADTSPSVAPSANCSFHQDEATHARQYLPTGFVMRTVVTTTPSNLKVNVTALSELAYSMATKASGGLTPTNAQKAIANISSVVGVADINTVEPKPLDSASTDDEKRLAALLTAVSGVANNSSALTTLSCPNAVTAGTPDATKCVVEKLAANANVSKPTGDNVAVTTVLADQLSTVTNGNLELQTLTSAAETKLKDTTIVYETGGGTSTPTQSLADKVRQFFSELTSTIKSLFDNTIGGESGAVKQARDFKAAVEAVQADVQPGVYTALMAQKAAELWVNYEAAPSTARVAQEIDRDGTLCWLATNLSVVGYNPITAGSDPTVIAGVKCKRDARNVYENNWVDNGDGTYNVDKKVGMQWFKLVKSGGNYVYYTSNNFSTFTARVNWSDRHELSRTNIVSECAWPTNDAAVCDSYTVSGAVQVSKASDNSFAGVHIQGSAPDSWEWRASGGVQLKNGYSLSNHAKSIIDITADARDSNGVLVSGAGAGAVLGGATASFSGPITLFGVDGSTQLATVSMDSGSKVFVENGEGQLVDFRLTYVKTGVFKLQGQLTMTRAVNEGGSSMFKGDLYNGSATTPFISAEIHVALDRTSYDSLLPHSNSNFEIGTFTFDGFVTAPDRPKLRLLVSGGAKMTTDSGASATWGFAAEDTLTANYLIYSASGTVRQDVTLTTYTVDVGHGIQTAVISDSTSGLQLSWERPAPGATTAPAPITISGQNVGTLGNGGSQAQVTFNPATTGETGYFLLDFGAQPTW